MNAVFFYLSCSSFLERLHPFKSTFVRGMQSALTITYFHYEWRLDWTTLKWTGWHCTSLDWTILGCAWLPPTPPHCSTLDWKGKHHTVQQFTALDRNDLHGTALHVSWRIAPEMGLSWAVVIQFPSSQIKNARFPFISFLANKRQL